MTVFTLLNLFQLELDPMERLLLINFEKDPDKIYIGFEPQVFNDDIHGAGHLIIGWRQDGKVDVYHDSNLKIDPQKYDIVGKGLENLVEVNFSSAYFEIGREGVEADYTFEDIHHRKVVIHISEKNSKKRKPFGLLAPMGSAAESPSALPLVLLHDFYFVRKKDTNITISIDGKIHQIDTLPLPIDGTWMYFTRYSPRPLIIRVNPAFYGEIKTLDVFPGQDNVESGANVFKLDWGNNVPSIKSITLHNHIHPLKISFNRSFPDIISLPDNALIKGGFEIEAHPSTGQIRGHYKVLKKKGLVEITMTPDPGWKPHYSKLSLFFLYNVARIFKKWPATYLWSGIITKNEKEGYNLESKWERTG